ncbi:MAG TPA: tRNA (adenosine(37)-N6)-threonylcarbamoyltransferase complex ATPase subunit type 1 TsaE [Sulfurospirillum arcachonense]|nr:tRNA (adenosine(37)-N6)-threonylcarbamoyltransferase complex ATPase subunit type 1 TsaE [Sulfurospirillum arcachonense]HIP45493.1 tRNA (adenosine(37)-N6)-threonylcarbamoyltransferase complex ATPase subunit type 1 TsaE [Sulfurospirillum arcachonense]
MKICSIEELSGFVKEIIDEIGSGGIILLKGDLASGKTTFVKKFVEKLGLHVDVSSPTFSIMNEYENIVCHYDIYQNGVEGFLQSGLLEKLDEPKYHLIEWADDRLEDILKKMGFDYMKIEIQTIDNKRGYICTRSK